MSECQVANAQLHAPPSGQALPPNSTADAAHTPSYMHNLLILLNAELALAFNNFNIRGTVFRTMVSSP